MKLILFTLFSALTIAPLTGRDSILRESMLPLDLVVQLDQERIYHQAAREAYVSFTERTNKLYGEVSVEILTWIYIYALEYNIPPLLLASLMYEESRFKVRAVSPINSNKTRDYGLMQLNSSNYDFFKKTYNANRDFNYFEVAVNIRIGSSYLLDLFCMFQDWEKAIQAYNCGPFRVSTNRVPSSSKEYSKRILKRF